MCLKDHGVYADCFRLCKKRVQIHVAVAQFHAVGCENRRHGRTGNLRSAVVDVEELHPCAEALHDVQSGYPGFGRPVGIKLKPNQIRVSLPDQKFISSQSGFDFPKFTVVIVIGKSDAGFF